MCPIENPYWNVDEDDIPTNEKSSEVPQDFPVWGSINYSNPELGGKKAAERRVLRKTLVSPKPPKPGRG